MTGDDPTEIRRIHNRDNIRRHAEVDKIGMKGFESRDTQIDTYREDMVNSEQEAIEMSIEDKTRGISADKEENRRRD